MAVETRTYAKSETAKAAMDELLSQGFSEVNASFKPDRARVDVDAPFGEGQRVAQILDRHGPLGPDDERSAGEPNARAGVVGKVTDWAAPLSSLLGWKVLSDYRSPFWPQALVHDPAPLSTRLGWPVLCGPTRSAAPRREATAPETATADASQAAGVAAPGAGEAGGGQPEPGGDKKEAKRH